MHCSFTAAFSMEGALLELLRQEDLFNSEKGIAKFSTYLMDKSSAYDSEWKVCGRIGPQQSLAENELPPPLPPCHAFQSTDKEVAVSSFQSPLSVSSSDVTVLETDVGDSTRNITACTDAAVECTFRSAVSYGTSLLTAPNIECIIQLPESKSIALDSM